MWYERLSNFLLSQNYERGKVNKALFIRRVGTNIILVQVYVDDIIFGSTNENLHLRVVFILYNIRLF